MEGKCERFYGVQREREVGREGNFETGLATDVEKA